MPDKLININGKTLMGYAADGHEIHYVGKEAKTSWILKKGKRSSQPFGIYYGSYLHDYEFKEETGNLDECNGGIVNNKFVYFATDTFPFYPRCLWGNVSKYFTRR